MSSFLLNWVNKRPNDSLETENPNKKVALEHPETVVENVESSDCDVHIPLAGIKVSMTGLNYHIIG